MDRCVAPFAWCRAVAGAPLPSPPPGPSLALRVERTLDEAYRRERSRLLAYAGRHAGADAAPDLVQDAFLRAAGSEEAGVLRNPGGFLQRIVRNLLIDRARREATRPALTPLGEACEAACSALQHEEAVAAEMLERFENALDMLPDRTRAVFLMHRVEDLTYREIHEKLGISVAGVEYHMMKALAHLTRTLDVER